MIIFYIGGVTYEEARYVAQLNSTTPGMRFVVGGTSVLNSKKFITDLAEASKRTRWVFFL